MTGAQAREISASAMLTQSAAALAAQTSAEVQLNSYQAQRQLIDAGRVAEKLEVRQNHFLLVARIVTLASQPGKYDQGQQPTDKSRQQIERIKNTASPVWPNYVHDRLG